MSLLYEIKFLDKPISFGEESYEKSVRVTIMLNHKKIKEHYLGVLDRNVIYDQIDQGEKIIYKNVYVRDFSLSEYRRIRNLEDDEYVEIKEFSIDYSLFDCDAVIDMTYAHFAEDVHFTNSVFYHGSLDFSRSRFSGDEADFSHTHFHTHHVIFQYSSFSGKNLTFEHSEFTVELLSFINASLKSETVNFKRVAFNKSKVKFHFAEFGDGLKTFEKMKFFGPVLDFRRVLWGSGKIDFRRCRFGVGHVTFEESEMAEGKMTFRLSSFDGGILTFRRAEFGSSELNLDHVKFDNQSVSFENVTGHIISMVDSDVNSSLDLRIKKVNTIDLSSSFLHSITDLNFPKTDALEKLVIVKVRNLGKIIIDWDKNNVLHLITSQNCSDVDMADQFNILKYNFTNNGQYQDEDFAYVYYKRYEHKVKRENARKRFRAFSPLVDVSFFLRKLIFDYIGLFATSPARVLVSMIATIIAFAGIYALFGTTGAGDIVNSVGATDSLNLFEKSMYHSAITFFTIGYGDFYPTSFSRVVSATEGWVGVFMMAYFTVAFVRKALR